MAIEPYISDWTNIQPVNAHDKNAMDVQRLAFKYFCSLFDMERFKTWHMFRETSGVTHKKTTFQMTFCAVVRGKMNQVTGKSQTEPVSRLVSHFLQVTVINEDCRLN